MSTIEKLGFPSQWRREWNTYTAVRLSIVSAALLALSACWDAHDSSDISTVMPDSWSAYNPFQKISESCPKNIAPVYWTIGEETRVFSNRCMAEIAEADPITEIPPGTVTSLK